MRPVSTSPQLNQVAFGYKFVVLDDEQDILENMAMVATNALNIAEEDIFKATTLEEAKEAINQNGETHVFLSDLHLTPQGYQGFEAVKYAAEQGVPAVFLHSKDISPKDTQTAERLGAHKVLDKLKYMLQDYPDILESAFSLATATFNTRNIND